MLDDMPKSVGLMFTPVSDTLYVTTGSWCPSRLHGTSYESMIHFKDHDTGNWKGRMVYHKSLRSAFYAHLGIVKELKKKITTNRLGINCDTEGGTID